MAFDPYRLPEPSPGAPAPDLHTLVAVPGVAQRWVAAMIDGVLTLVPLLAAWAALMVLAVAVVGPEGPRSPSVEAALGPAPYPLALVVQVLYGAAFESSSWQATPGKRLLGLRVVSEAGGRLSLPTAVARNLAKALGLLMCNLLAVSVLLDDRRRGAWDRVAGTRVIPQGSLAPPRPPPQDAAADRPARASLARERETP